MRKGRRVAADDSALGPASPTACHQSSFRPVYGLACGISSRIQHLPVHMHSGISLFLQTRLPLRGQRRLDRPKGRRTGFPFNPASRCSTGHLKRDDCTRRVRPYASAIGKIVSTRQAKSVRWRLRIRKTMRHRPPLFSKLGRTATHVCAVARATARERAPTGSVESTGGAMAGEVSSSDCM